PRETHPAARQRRDQACITDEAEAQSAVWRRNGCAKEAEFLHLGNARMGIFVIMLQLARRRDNLTVDEPAYRLDYLAIQSFVHRLMPSQGATIPIPLASRHIPEPLPICFSPGKGCAPASVVCVLSVELTPSQHTYGQ